MIVYAESSAVLAWLLDEKAAPVVRETLAQAERVVASTLTVLECQRTLIRAEVTGRLSDSTVLAARQMLAGVTPGWVLLDMAGPPIARAAQPFPAEPIRTLDAIHLATALEAQSVGIVAMLSLDDRIRDNAVRLGMPVLPAA